MTCTTLGVISIATTSTDEAALIRKILGGRSDLFEDLIAPHLPPLLRIVRAIITSHMDVEDIVQQTVLEAFVHLKQFRGEASFRTWLIRIGLNEARSWRRKCAYSGILPLDFLSSTQFPPADETDSPWFECERSEAIGQLRAALARLPEKYRVVVLLRDFEELSLSEVAQRLGLTISAVKTRQLRARQKMAKFLGSFSQSHSRSSACR